MKKYLFRVILSAAKNLALMGLVVGFFACGDDSGSTSASGENGSSHTSSSTPIEDLDESSSSINDDSSSSVIPGSSSSVILSDSEGSSSSVKGSVPADGASSSSVIPDPDRESSSSSEKFSSSSAKSSSSVNSSSSNKQSSSSSVKQSSSSLAKSSSSGEYVPYAHTSDLGPLWFDDVFKQFVDTRNNRSYYYLTIYNKDHSDSLTVFAENLNIGEMVEFIDSTSFQSDNKKIERFCYDNDTTNCDRYGGLYQWAEMMGFNDSCNTKSCAHLIQEDHQGICPKEWRLMTYDDYKFIAQSENVIHNSYEDMRTQNGFNGYNATGFSLVPAGYIWWNSFQSLQQGTYWHYPAESVKFDANLYSKGGYAGMSGGGLNEQNTKKRYGLSVRCAKVE